MYPHTPAYLASSYCCICYIFVLQVADTTADYEVLSISIGLTPAGLASKDTVIACILEYIDMANRQGVPDYILQVAPLLTLY